MSSLGWDQEMEGEKGSLSHRPSYHPQHQRTKHGMLSRAVLLAKGKQIRAFGLRLSSRISNRHLIVLSFKRSPSKAEAFRADS